MQTRSKPPVLDIQPEAAWASLVAISIAAAGTLAGCFATRSQEFACTVTADCDSGRVCQSGFCVLGARGSDSGTTCEMFQTPHVMGCMIPPPGPDLELAMAGTYTYNTDLASLVAPDSSTSAPPNMVMSDGTQVISIQSLTIGSGVTLRVIGSHPLLAASWSTITVNGTIDVSSHAPTATVTDLVQLTGAGSNPSACATHAAGAGGANGNNGGGGGGGGGFAGAGGRGGTGFNNNNSRGVAGTAVAAPSTVIGGCSGGKGGDGNNPGGTLGAGGGAIQLVAITSITVNGTIHAGGAGGGPAVRLNSNDRGGGGGGGSGGLIGLDAPTVTIAASAIVAANGGGGGGGTNGNNPVNAGGDATANATPAPGGTTDGVGKGGPGSAAATLTGTDGIDSPGAGGGGAGGGAGFVVVHSGGMTISPTAVRSPDVTMMP
jgi:hypothetical protein